MTRPMPLSLPDGVLVLCLALSAIGSLRQAGGAAPPPAVGGLAVTDVSDTSTCRRLANGDVVLGEIRLHRRERELSFPGAINQLAGALEVLISTPDGRLHEALLRTAARPLHLQTMLYLLGLRNGRRLTGPEGRQGDIVDIDIEWKRATGEIVREPVESWILDQRTGKQAERCGWVFVGSAVADGVFLADATGNVAVTYSVSDTVLDTPDRGGEDDTLFVANSPKREPGLDALVRIVVIPRATSPLPEEKPETPAAPSSPARQAGRRD